MHPLTPQPSSLLDVRAALADRTTRREGHPPPTDGLTDHLRVVIARVLRTGRGPAALVRWVHGQLPTGLSGGGEAAERLADDLLRRLLPPASVLTVGG